MYLCNINIGKNISELVNLVTRDQQVPQSYYAQLKLKLWQIKCLRVIVMVFFIHEIFRGTYWMITVDILGDTNEYSRVVLNLCLEYFKLIYYAALLWVFRPRRNWPEHYGVGIDNLMRRNGNSRKNEVQTPIETFEINDSDMADEPIQGVELDDIFKGVGPEDSILILNPCNDNPYDQRGLVFATL